MDLILCVAMCADPQIFGRDVVACIPAYHQVATLLRELYKNYRRERSEKFREFRLKWFHPVDAGAIADPPAWKHQIPSQLVASRKPRSSEYFIYSEIIFRRIVKVDVS